MFLRIFDRYIGRQVWMATLTGVLVLSGVMVLGNVYKKLDQLLGNTEVPMAFVLEFVGLVIPFSLIFTIPWAFLTSILLVYGRMSADNELVSLRMTGTSMPRICLPVFLLGAALSGGDRRSCLAVSAESCARSVSRVSNFHRGSRWR